MEQLICQMEDLEEKRTRVFRVKEHEIGILLLKGKIHAFENYCPHMGGPICLGDVVGAIKVNLREDKQVIDEYVSENDMRIVCPWHGFEFHSDTGNYVVDDSFKLKKYKTEIKENNVYIHF